MSIGKGRGIGTALEFFLILFLVIALIIVTLLFFFHFKNKDRPTGPNDTKPGSTEVKIDLLGSDNSSIIGKTIPFALPEGASEIICEPGVSYYTEPFYVKNIGDVKVDYIVSISQGTSVEAKAFMEAFDFWITTNPSVPADSVPLTDYRGVLEAGKTTESYYLVITMKPALQNEYQGKTFQTVGITVTATEHNSSGQE